MSPLEQQIRNIAVGHAESLRQASADAYGKENYLLADELEHLAEELEPDLSQLGYLDEWTGEA